MKPFNPITAVALLVLALIFCGAYYRLMVALEDDRARRKPQWDPKEGERVYLRVDVEILVADKPVTLKRGHRGTLRLRSRNDDETLWYVRFDNGGPQAVPFTLEELCQLGPL